jgi:streptogramin lyase
MGSDAREITAGPDGNLYFALQDEMGRARIGRLTATGVLTTFLVPSIDGGRGDLGGITVGADRNIWFANRETNTITRMTLNGIPTFSAFDLPTPDSGPSEIVAGPDRNVWFVEAKANKIGRLTPAGVVDEFPVPTANSHLVGITAGPDGNIWFTEFDTRVVGRLTPNGSFTEFPVPTTGAEPVGPAYVAAGPDGNLWVTDEFDRIWRVTVQGAMTPFPLLPPSRPNFIVSGPDGNVWFAEYGTGKLGQITPAGKITEFAVNNRLRGLTVGPDCGLWFTEFNQTKIVRFTP